MAENYSQFDQQPLGKQWRHGSSHKTLTDRDPYSDEVLVEIPLATREDVDEAYQIAAVAQKEWANTSPNLRSEILLKAASIFDQRREEIISWLIKEAGSTRLKATIEWASAKAITLASASFPYRVSGKILLSDTPGKENRVYRRPLGVIGIISPWNFPLHLTQRSLAPALALGNAVVLKPASNTPITGGLLVAKIFEEAGLPPGLLSVTIGSGKDIGDYFVEHPQPRMISFTGSTPVGKRIGQIASGGAHLKRVALELGGNSPFVVLKDADIDQAVKAAVFGRFLHQGQICMSVNRIIIEAPIYDRFVEKFCAHVRKLKVGNPSDDDTVIGPIIDENQLQQILQKIDQTKQEGGKLVVGGAPQGRLLPPHVFVDVSSESPAARDEWFAPVVCLLKAADEREALTLANASEYGLSSAVFCGDLEKGVQFAQGIEAGMTHINDMSVGDEPHAPFGGEKNSGLGRFGGDWIIEEMTATHWISLQHTPRPYPF